MAHCGHHSRSKRATLTRWSFVLRCLLLLAAWQGPLPWCHCHGTLASSAAPSIPWLAAHLQSYHPSVASLSNVVFGWHVHFDSPGSPSDDRQQPKKERAAGTRLANAVDCLSASVAAAAAAKSVHVSPQIDPGQDRLAIVALSPSQNSAHFFDAYAPTLSLPMRFCVSRS